MLRRNLSTSGLSLSQAQSISNLCNQRANDIAADLSGINNASKTFKIGEAEFIETPAKKLPNNVVELLLEMSKLHSCQSFLMEHIKLKERLIKTEQLSRFSSTLEQPEEPEYKRVLINNMVDEQWGWDQLSNAEHNEYLQCEAYAAHIGQFIHKRGVLDVLRTELPHIKTLEFIELNKDSKTPLTVVVHHTQSDLLAIHNQLAELHREYEQKVNYYKAKVKNLVTSENARIAKENGEKQSTANAENQILRSEYQVKFEIYLGQIKKLEHEFEQTRQNTIKELANLRIEVDPRFQDVIDLYKKSVLAE